MTKQILLDEARKLSPSDREEIMNALAESLIAGDEQESATLSPEFIARLDLIDSEIDAHPELLVTLEDVERELNAEFKS